MADSASPSPVAPSAPKATVKPEPATTVQPTPTSVAEPKAGSPIDIAAVWESVCASVASSPAGAALVEALRLVSLDKGIATVETDDPGVAGRARTRRRWLEERISDVCGVNVRLEVRSSDESGSTPSLPEEPVDSALMREAANNPLVQRAMDLFQARLVRVEPPTRRSTSRNTD